MVYGGVFVFNDERGKMRGREEGREGGREGGRGGGRERERERERVGGWVGGIHSLILYGNHTQVYCGLVPERYNNHLRIKDSFKGE